MSKELLRYEDLSKIENKLIKPILENINKGLKAIFEGKNVKLMGSDFDKNIYFYVDKEFKTARWDLSENKINISEIKDVEIEPNSLEKAFTNTIVEAINLVSENKLDEAENKFADAINIKIKEKTSDKLNIFGKRPVIKESKNRLVNIGKLVEKKEIGPIKVEIKRLTESLEKLIEKFLGKEKLVEGTKFEFNLTEGKLVRIDPTSARVPTLLRNIEIAKKEANNLDIKPMLEDINKFVNEHEELFLLNSGALRVKLNEIAKKDIAITNSMVSETIDKFNKIRNESESFKSLVKQVLEEAPSTDADFESPSPDAKNDTEKQIDGDKAVDSINAEDDKEKLSFMQQFVDVLTQILEKVKEVGADDGEIVRRVDNSLKIIARAKEVGKWDKEELAEIAREAIELAAKIEGIEPEETEVSKRSEEEEDSDELDKETISGEEGEAAPETGKAEIREAVEGEEDTEISPEGDIEFSPEDFEDVDDEMDTLVCIDCEKEFKAESGEEEYHCPYCGEMVDADIEEPLEGPEEETEETEEEPEEINELLTLPQQPTPKAFENDKVTVMGPVQNAEDFCEYGKGSMWCPADPSRADLFDSYDNQGYSFYIVIPNDGSGKIAVAVKPDGTKTYYDSDDREMSDAEFAEVSAGLGIPAGVEASLKDESPAADQPGQEVAGNVDYAVKEEDVEDDMRAKDKRDLILGDEEEKISEEDFAGKEEAGVEETHESPGVEKCQVCKAHIGTRVAKNFGGLCPDCWDENKHSNKEESALCECGQCEQCSNQVENEEFERVEISEADRRQSIDAEILATYRSKSDPSRRYYIKKPHDSSKPIYCSCPAFMFQKGKPAWERTCWHLDNWKSGGSQAVKEEGAPVSDQPAQEITGNYNYPGALRENKKNPKRK
jgi:hypothetical protein